MPKPTGIRYVKTKNGYEVTLLRQVKGGKIVVGRQQIDGDPSDQAFKDAVTKLYEDTKAA